VAKRRRIKGRNSDVAVRVLAKCFLLLVGVLVYHQSSQSKQYQERLRTACAARGGKLTLTNLCINLSWTNEPTNARARAARRPGFRVQEASQRTFRAQR
jgi:hypothetical protein